MNLRLHLFTVFFLFGGHLKCQDIVELVARTPIKVVLNEPLINGLIREGQSLICQGQGEVKVNGHVAIKHAATAYARIVDIEWNRKKKPEAVLVELTEIVAADGQSIPLQGAPIFIQVNEMANGLGQLLSAMTSKSIYLNLSK